MEMNRKLTMRKRLKIDRKEHKKRLNLDQKHALGTREDSPEHVTDNAIKLDHSTALLEGSSTPKLEVHVLYRSA